MKLKTEGAEYVLDSSAVIALIREERGWEKVRGALEHAVISAVNVTETLTKLIHKGGEPRLVERYLRGLGVEVVPWDEDLAWESRDLCPLAWTHGISFADRACLAVARHCGLAAMTSDAGWKRADLGVKVVLFREGRSKGGVY